MLGLLNSIAILGLISALSVHADERPLGVPSEARWVKVDRVTDGDTIVLMDRTRVRLHGIDAPEQDQPYGSAATKALEGMSALAPIEFYFDLFPADALIIAFPFIGWIGLWIVTGSPAILPWRKPEQAEDE